jgi:hypothetical protein
MELMSLKENYHKIIEKRDSIIKKITRIDRPEELSFLFEDADFSEITIKTNSSGRRRCKTSY